MNERRPERQPAAEDRRSISGGDERPRWQSAETLADNLPGEAAGSDDARPWTPELIRLLHASISGRRGDSAPPPSTLPTAVAGLQLTYWQTR